MGIFQLNNNLKPLFVNDNQSACIQLVLASLLLFFLTTSPAVNAQGFGGPDAVENQIADDSRPKPAAVEERLMQPWFDWKQSFQEKSGISFGIDYTGYYFNANNSLGEDAASSGIVRFFGSWDLLGRGTKNSGALVWKVENRHAYGDVAPSGFGLGELGYVGIFAPPFSDEGSRVTNFYWRQRFNEGKSTLVAGYLDVTDAVDTFIGGTPWTGFGNFVFSTGSASMFLPNDATLGIAAATMLTENLYIIGNIYNAYADPTDPFNRSFDRFFKENEYFTSLEIGWTKGQERIYQDNTHVTLWHVDDSVMAGAIEGWGVAFSHVQHINDQWMPFLRGGYAQDGGSLLQKSVGVGVLYQPNTRGELGFGMNWGEPNETTFTTGLDDQYTMEAFYRFQLTQQFAITPSIEYIKNPALNPQENDIWVVGLRARFAL